MRSRRTLSAADIAGCLAASVLLILCAASTARAQTGPPAPGTMPANPRRAEALDRQQREAQLRNSELLHPPAAANGRGVEAVVEQMKLDFKRIQILRNEIVRHIKSDRPLDYKFIAGEAGEIHKRAGRLQTYMVRPAGDGKDQKKQTEISGEQLKDELARLCQRIDSFTENPLFKVPGTVDVQQSAKAGRDLQSIIELSGDIKKSTERLSKTSRR